MLILDKARALDLLIASAERVLVPEQFVLVRSDVRMPVVGMRSPEPIAPAPIPLGGPAAPQPQPFWLPAA